MLKPSTSAFHQLEQTGWESAAAAYDDAFARLTTQSVSPLLDTLELASGTRLLDLCCGPGYVAGEAAHRGAKATGLNFSAAMVERARKNHPNAQFKQGDAEVLPFADASFDAVSMNYGLLHLDRPEQALAEISRVLVPGGRFAFTVWAPPAKTLGFQLVLGAVEACGKMDVALPPGPPFFQYSDPKNTTAALEAVGLAQVKIVEVKQVWRFQDAEEIFTAMMSGTVRTAALLRAQSATDLERIRVRIIEKAHDFRTSSGIEIPMPSVLSSARKPA